MSYDFEKLTAIETLMSVVATTGALTNTRLLEEARRQNITSSMGTLHRYRTEIERRRSQEAVSPNLVSSSDTSAKPTANLLPGDLMKGLEQVRASVEQFGVRVAQAVHIATDLGDDRLTAALSEQRAAFERRLASANLLVVDLQTTADELAAEVEATTNELGLSRDVAERERSERDKVGTMLEAARSEAVGLTSQVERLLAQVAANEATIAALQSAKVSQWEELMALRAVREELKARDGELVEVRERLAVAEVYIKTNERRNLYDETYKSRLRMADLNKVDAQAGSNAELGEGTSVVES